MEFWCDGQGTLIYQVNEGPVTRLRDPGLCQAFIANYLREGAVPDRDGLREYLLQELLGALDPVPPP